MADETEISVEGEPWTGLLVVADLSKPEDQGYYGLVQASEWQWTGDPKDPDRAVTLWRGPSKPDEKVQRKHLLEVECHAVHVDENGFYTCTQPFSEAITDLVEELTEPLLNELANERAAELASYIHDGYEDDFGEDVWIKAEYGNAVAVNGDLVSRKHQKPPRGWVLTERGGFDPSGMEEEIDLESLIDTLVYQISGRIGRQVDSQIVTNAVAKEYGAKHGYIVWRSSSGDMEVWTSKKALRQHEKEEEERKKAAQERRARELQEERKKEEEAREKAREERRQKMRKGGFPGPKDWSPTGETD